MDADIVPHTRETTAIDPITKRLNYFPFSRVTMNRAY